jgi:uncharacterized protein (TIGR03437 family)
LTITSAGGGQNSAASSFTVTPPSTASNSVVLLHDLTSSANGIATGSCVVPPQVTTFSTTSAQVWLYFDVDGAKAGDTAQMSFIRPDGVVYTTLNATVSSAGANGYNCFSYQIPISGASAAGYPGTWSIQTTWDKSSTPLFSLAFILTSAGNPASVTITSVANAASFKQSFAPGMLMSVFGTGLSSGPPQSESSAPLPTTVNGNTVTINGILAPLLYVSATQINLQIPYEIAPGNAVLTVNTGGQSASTNFTLEAAAPGIFTDSQDAHVVPNESATAGSIIGIYVTGAGQVTPAEATGNVLPAGMTPVPNLPVSVTVGGVPATPVYVGIPAWSVAVLQINFVVPANSPTGTQAVVVTIGGVASAGALLMVTN